MKLLIPLLTYVFLINHALAGNGYGYGANNSGSLAEGPILQAQTVPFCQLTPQNVSGVDQQTIEQLQFMREEEKLARDVYQFLYDRWQVKIFSNIINSEQVHMDNVKRLIDAYGIDDPAQAGFGIFTNAELQKLYDELTMQGSRSQADAYRVGALIEEVDIEDLNTILANTSEPALVQLYSSLVSGSYNHLRAFVGQIERLGETYQAQTLTQDEVETILSGEADNKLFAVSATGAFSMDATGATSPIINNGCFYFQIRVNNQLVNNNVSIDYTDTIAIDVNIVPDYADLDRTAELITLVKYTNPENSSILLMKSAENWKVWDGSIYTIEAEQQVQLSGQQGWQVFQGALDNIPGNFEISVAYRLQDGQIIYGLLPVQFSVTASL